MTITRTEKMKSCTKCGKLLPLECFHRNCTTSDGHTFECKECAKARAAEHRREHPATYYRLEIARKSTPLRMEQRRAITARHKLRHPQEVKSRYLLNLELRTGRMLRQPCEICGNLKAQAHHDDYSRPLDVRWLCNKHHKEYHANNK